MESDFRMEGSGKTIGDSLASEMCSKRKAAGNRVASQKSSLTWGEEADLKKKMV